MTIYASDIEHKINDLITEYFITSGKKKVKFTRWLLYSNGFKLNDKIECLSYISNSIQNKELQEVFEMAIMFSRRFCLIKDKLAYGEVCFCDDSENALIKTVSDDYRYENVEITLEYIEIMRDTAMSTIKSLGNVMKTINGTK